jgi:AcrR family transcriptional regulator
VKKARKTSYHHGDLRNALLVAALELVQAEGVGAISLREVARRAGVSHAAPAYHFGDKAGLLTALAVQGFERFRDAMRAAAARAADQPKTRLAWVGWGYVMFAAEHRAYFEIMFRPELLHFEDPQLATVAAAAYSELTDSVRLHFGADIAQATLDLYATQAWSEAHGLATLWLHGNLQQHKTPAALGALAKKMFKIG